ncbi:MAG: hypothetical protein IJH34_05940 [Romboutsia sp.]|nr:hypothetical protein [Romboutsia sp.]
MDNKQLIESLDRKINEVSAYALGKAAKSLGKAAAKSLGRIKDVAKNLLKGKSRPRPTLPDAIGTAARKAYNARAMKALKK